MATDNFPVVGQGDLQDPKLSLLNRNLKFLSDRAAYLEGAAGPVKIQNSLSASDVTVRRSSVPTGADQVLTLGDLNRLGLYGSTTVITAGTSTQPSPSSYSSIIEADQYGGFTATAINAAIAAAGADGAAIHCRAGSWDMDAMVHLNKSNILLYGDGSGTVFQVPVGGSFPDGVVRVISSGCALEELVIDGAISSTTQVNYADLFGSTPGDNSMHGDPMFPTLTDGSAVWITNGASSVGMWGVEVRKCSGYAVVIDCRTQSCSNVTIERCNFHDNIAITFGDGTYTNTGSWTSGILYQAGGATGSVSVSGTTATWVSGNYLTSWQAGQYVTIGASQYLVSSIGAWGLTATLSTAPAAGTHSWSIGNNRVIGLKIMGCRFDTLSGNGIWGHSYSTDNLHESLTVYGNSFSNMGRDGVLVGAVRGAVVQANTFYRIGYVGGAPAYYPGQYAVAIDTAGYCTGVKYIGNSMTSVNGGFIDLDGASDGEVSGNTLSIPDSTDAQYTIDQVASYGYGGYGNITKGIQTNSTYDPRGAKKLLIYGNTIRGLRNSAVALFNCEDSFVIANNIVQAASSIDAPMVLACSGTSSSPYVSPPRYCRYNTITQNRITYDSAGGQYAIYETDSYGANVGPNFISGNTIIGDNKGEFSPSANGLSAGTRSAFSLYTNSGTPSTSQADLYSSEQQVEGTGATTATKLYSRSVQSGTMVLLESTIHQAGLKNVSLDGASGTGAITTAGRTTVAFADIVATGHLYADAFMVMTDTTFGYPNDSNADLLDDTYGLIRYNSTAKDFEKSIALSAGHRVWVPIGSGGGTAAGSDSYVQYNHSGVFGASANFTYDQTAQLLTVIGIASTAAIAVSPGYIQSGGGFISQAASWQAVQGQASGGGALFAGYGLAEHSSKGGYIDLSPLTYANYPATLTGLSSFGANDVLLWASGVNGTVSPNVSYGLNTNAYVNAASGFATASSYTTAIQAPTGGVSAKWLIGTTSLTLSADTQANAGLSSTGQVRIICDSGNSNKAYISENGGAYVPLLGSGGPGGSVNEIQYNNGSGGFAAISNFSVNPTSKVLTVTGVISTAAIVAVTGYIQSDGGFLVTSSNTSTTSIYSQNGGVTAKWLISGTSITMLSTTQATAGVSDATDVRIICDSANGYKAYISEAGGAYVPLVGSGSPGGSTGEIQYNNGSGGFGANSGLVYDTGTNTLISGGQSTQYPVALRVKSSTHASSRRACILLGNAVSGGGGDGWELGQDSAASGTKDFYLYSYQQSAIVLRVGATLPNFGMNASPSASSGVILTIGGTASVAAIVVSGGFIQSAGGFLSQSSSYNSIQTSGGFYGNQLTLVERSNPGVSAGGTASMYADSSTHAVYVSVNGGAYVALGGNIVNVVGSGNISVSVFSGTATVSITSTPSFVTVTASTGFKAGTTASIDSSGRFIGSGVAVYAGIAGTGFNFIYAYSQAGSTYFYYYYAGGTDDISAGGNTYHFDGGMLTKKNGVPYNSSVMSVTTF